MRRLIPFKLDPIFRMKFNPRVPCVDCGKVIEFRHARIVMVDISEKKKVQLEKEVSLDEFAKNTVWQILCEECWKREHPIEPKAGLIQ